MGFRLSDGPTCPLHAVWPMTMRFDMSAVPKFPPESVSIADLCVGRVSKRVLR